MPGRKYSIANTNYRYGFNGQEKSAEINGSENLYTAEFWEYDSRIGRRWNVDPIPDISISPYNAFAGNPIFNSDPLGDTTIPTVNGGTMELMPNSFTTFDGKVKNLKGSSVTVRPDAGTLNTFTAGTDENPLTFEATFGSSSGKFLGYFNSKDHSQSFDNYYNKQTDRAHAMDVVDGVVKDGLWDKDLSNDQARKRTLALGFGYTLPNPILRYGTAAANAGKGMGLSEDVGKTFRFGKYEKITLDKSMILSRYYDNIKALPSGRFMTNSTSGFKFWDRMTMAIRPSWNNMTKVAQWEIPAGATIYKGRAAMQFPWIGGKTQFFVPQNVLESATLFK